MICVLLTQALGMFWICFDCFGSMRNNDTERLGIPEKWLSCEPPDGKRGSYGCGYPVPQGDVPEMTSFCWHVNVHLSFLGGLILA